MQHSRSVARHYNTLSVPVRRSAVPQIERSLWRIAMLTASHQRASGIVALAAAGRSERAADDLYRSHGEFVVSCPVGTCNRGRENSSARCRRSRLDQRRSLTRTHLSSNVAALQMQGRCSASGSTPFPHVLPVDRRLPRLEAGDSRHLVAESQPAVEGPHCLA